MKICVVFIALGLVGSVLTTKIQLRVSSYHDAVGIPLAERIFKAETKWIEKGIVSGDSIYTRIVGGSNSFAGNHPYLGGLIIHLAGGKASLCGSSLITETRSLTAGHCWNDGKHNGVMMTLVHGTETVFYNGVRTETNDVVVHENFDYSILSNDIAMIKHQNIAFTDNIKPVGLPVGNLQTEQFTNMKATAIGYGMISSDKSSKIDRDQVRREVTITVIKNSLCQRYFGPAVTTKTLCTVGLENRGIGVCQGDSGGPLTVPNNGTKILIGITSFSMLVCQNPPYYSGFTRVTEHIPWINDKLK